MYCESHENKHILSSGTAQFFRDINEIVLLA